MEHKPFFLIVKPLNVYVKFKMLKNIPYHKYIQSYVFSVDFTSIFFLSREGLSFIKYLQTEVQFTENGIISTFRNVEMHTICHLRRRSCVGNIRYIRHGILQTYIPLRYTGQYDVKLMASHSIQMQ